METIKNFILDLFKEAKYKRIEFEKIDIYKHSEHPDYWIITDRFSVTKQQELFETLSKIHMQYNGMDKNTTLLLLNDLDSSSALNASQCIQVENDPFFFKKNVLSYKPETVTELLNIFKSQKISDFSKYLFMEATYNDLVKNTEGVAALAYSIAHKLPFIIMNVETQKYECKSFYNQIKSTDKDIIDKLSSLENKMMDEYIDSEISKDSSDEL